MFGSRLGFSELDDLMVQLSMTLSYPEPRFQGQSIVQGRISRKRCILWPNISGALCIYDGYTVSADGITTFLNETNAAQSLSNK